MGKSIKIGNILINKRVLSAFIICSILIFAGAVRILSYLRGSFVSQIIGDTFLQCFAYQPESYFNVSFFKILATPSVIACIYFLFRGLNEKYILKRMMHSKLPTIITNRPKQPYRAPISQALLSNEKLRSLWQPLSC